ncbi:HAD family hydrolase [Shouchella patagoniensis]|uniref:HAD family hydrolase n=1 Tax=Shouchella patagoniensis TaxID=228576 RepID=UPI001FE25120|nr:HAD-IA family hydrolase [Shouchella patagoniensis]
MREHKAVLFDLDDTLLDRNKAVDNMFLLVIETCYENVGQVAESEMLIRFKEYDKRSYGYSDKTELFESFFNEFPPNYRLPRDSIQDFWDHHFPNCFSIDPNTINVVNMIQKQVKVAIITNGSTQRQKAKIRNTKLNDCFDTIIISEEVGLSKPDKRIFDLALNKLNVQPETALFVGDDLEKDISGCQHAKIKGIWFNPHKITNDTEIKPYAEIRSLNRLLSYFP